MVTMVLFEPSHPSHSSSIRIYGHLELYNDRYLNTLNSESITRCSIATNLHIATDLRPEAILE